jgi:uncharacterized protein (DUF1697 family)
MNSYISMLRGINVSGQKKIKMEELKKLYESLGFSDVQTYIQSGNVIFKSSEKDASKLAGRIKQKMKQIFGFDVSIIIRTKDELEELIKNNPFTKKDASKLHVTFLSTLPISVPVDEINKVKSEAEEFFIADQAIYLFCPNGYGRSKLSNTFFEKKLLVSATTRNWGTVKSLFNMAK